MESPLITKHHDYQVPLDWSKGSIFIYGTGSFASDIFKVLEQHNIKPVGYIDHKKREHALVDNLRVYLPNDPGLNTEQRRNSIVILGIHNREVDIPNILGNLKQFGYSNILSPIDLYDHFAEELGNRYWLTSRIYYSSYTSEVDEVYNMLSDEKSRETLRSLLRFRTTGDYSLLPQPDTEHQYFPPDLPLWLEPIRFVDCGAYNGDTIQSFVKSGFNFQAIAAFEPDQDNYRELSAYIAKNFDKLPNSSLFPCGVYSSTTQMTFETGKGEASVASRTGSSIIQCISLDESIPTFQPTLIKMDIEGAEIEALHGAGHIITKFNPALAISVYHTPAHIWQIPLLIKEIANKNGLQHTYHLRAHAHNCFDTIFYAVPNRDTP